MAAKNERVSSSVSESVNEGHPFKLGALVGVNSSGDGKGGCSSLFGSVDKGLCAKVSLSELNEGHPEKMRDQYSAVSSPILVKACPYSDVRMRRCEEGKKVDEVKNPNKISAGNWDKWTSPWASSYTVTVGGCSPSLESKVRLNLDDLLPAAMPMPPSAATAEGPGDSGVNPCGDRPSPWARWQPGVAAMPVEVMLKETGTEPDGCWEWVALDPPVEKKEQGFEKEMEQEKRIEKEETKEKDLDQEKMLSQKTGEKEVETKKQDAKMGRRRRARKGFLSATEKVWARARELNRSLQPLLFPGLRKRKYSSLLYGLDLRTIERANAERLKAEKKKEEMKEKEKQEKEVKANVGLFVFGQKDEEKKELRERDPVVVKDVEPKSYYEFKNRLECGSEIHFKGGVVAQVGEEESAPEPEKIQVLHRVGGVLKVVDLRLEQKLGDLFGEGFVLHGELAEEGYFATLGGRLLDSNMSVANLGLQQGQEVVFHRRLRGGGFSGGGKGAREGRANSVAAGDWTCGNCHQPGCWNARSTCYRCGAPRYQSQGLSGQANSGARDMEGRYQSGVGTGMGGYRVIGPNGRDQSYIPGGNPTQRKGPQPGGKGRNKVGGDTGAGVGVGFGTGGGVVGGGGGGDNRSAFSWLGGGGFGNPLPPGMVPTERDQALFCVDHLKGLLKDERDLEVFTNFWEERLPAKPEPAPVKTPTEAQRAEVFAQLTRRRDGLMKRVKEGQVRVDAAKAKVRQEEAVVEELERDLKAVSDQVDAHRAENLRRAEEAKAPRVEEVGSDMDLEAESSSGGEFGVNQVAGKRRKVVRKNRFQGNKLTKEELWQFFSGMPNPDRDWFKRQFLGDVGSGVGCTDHSLGKEEVEPDKVELNARASLAPTQEEVANTPCG